MSDSHKIKRGDLVFYHSPNSRAAGVRFLLEELGADYRLEVLNMKAGEQRKAPFLAVNPLGKVPAIVHDGALVTEQGAIYLYLADLFPEAGLAPAIGDKDRGPYLRWLFLYGSCFEPALVDRSMKRDPAPQGTSPYGDWDTLFDTVLAAIRKGPYLLGDRLTAADLLWGMALRWMTMFKLVPASPEVTGYSERICSRPAFARVSAADAELAAAHDAAAAQKG
ncbi:Glutathione S-transferase [Minicystis rosea]|nr:Glutathione S-transferase [Minicystis rosea]